MILMHLYILWSGRSKLVNEIIRAINSYTSRDLSRCSYNLVKSAATELSKLKGDKILVVDDINTSGSTLDEILRKISEINKGCEIYLHTDR